MAELMDKQGILDELRHRSGGAQQEQTPMMDKQGILDYLQQRSSAQQQGTGTFAPVKQTPSAKYFATVSAGKAGWADYQAQQERYKNQPKQEPKEKSVWDTILEGIAGIGSDTTLPGVGGSQVVTMSKEAQANDPTMPRDNWTDDERYAFGYLWNTQRQKAYDYARAVNNAYARQQEEKAAKEAADKASSGFWSGAANTAGAIVAAPLGLADTLKNLIDYGATGHMQEDGQLSPFEWSQAATSGISQKLNEKGGVIDESVPILGGKGWGDVYSLGTSIVKSITAAYTGGAGQALITNFGPAMASATDSAKERGATDEQAMSYGFLSGLAEAAAEMVGVDNLLKLGAADSLKAVMKNLLKQGTTEALEEGLTSVVDNLADNLVLQDKSVLNQRIAAYTEQGMTPAQAKKQAWMDMAGDVIFDMLGGFVSGAASGGLETIVQTVPTIGRKPATSTQSEETAQAEKVPTQAETPTQDAQAAQTPSQPMTPQQAMQETIAETIGVPSVTKAVESFRQNGKVSNSQAEAIIADDGVFREILEMTGIAPPSTKSESRAAVKQAVAKLAQESVDNTPTGDYDRITNQGGVTNGESKVSGADATGLPGGTGAAWIRGADDGAISVAGRAPGGMEEGGGLGAQSVAGRPGSRSSEVQLRVPPVLRVSSNLKAARVNSGIQGYDLYDTTSDPHSYEKALTEGRNSDAANGWCVTPKSTQELVDENVRTFMNESRTVGVGVKPDGDIVAVFKNQNGGPKRALDTAMPMAIEMGGDRLDCYGEGLVRTYENYGFIPVARVEFNPKYANEGWTPDKGTPYIYFMVHNGDSADVVTEKIRTYNHATAEELAALPTFGKEAYDDAMSYRDNFIAQRKSQPANPNNSVGASTATLPEHSVGAAMPHETKRSRVIENTYANATDPEMRAEGEAALKEDPDIGNYSVIPESESLFEAEQRTRDEADMQREYDYLMEKRGGWTSADNDTAMKLRDYFYQKADPRFADIVQRQAEEGTQAGQFIQSFAKYTRMTGEDAAAEVVTEMDKLKESDVPKRFYKDGGFEQWKGDVITSSMNIAKQIDSVEDGDVDGMKDIIRSMAKWRKTTAWFGLSSDLSKAAEAAMKDIDFETAKAIANAQLSTLPSDFKKRPVGQVVKTIRIHNMLSALTTINRNLVGNTAVGFIDATSDSTSGRLIDALVSKVTGKRTVGNDIKYGKTYMDAAWKATKMASLCAELDIPMDSESRFTTGTTRTYSPQGNPIMRFMSAYEKYMKYALEVTDQFYQGGANAAVDASLREISGNETLTQEEAEAIAKLAGQRRTLKDERAATRMAKKVRQGLNEFGTESMGLGDLTMPFASIGSTSAHVAVDYTAGTVTGLAQVFKLMSDVKKGRYVDGVKTIYKNGKPVRTITLAEAQRAAVTNAGRGITGLGLVTAFAGLAAAGILKAHDDKDKDKRGLEQAQNLSGAQLNIDAALRGLQGKSTEWQNDDLVISVDFLEPFNAQMHLGYLLSQDESVLDAAKSYPKHAIRSVVSSIADMPAMQGMQEALDILSGLKDVGDEEGSLAQWATDSAGQVIGSTASGFIPGWLRQMAQVIDPYYRDTSGDTATDAALNQVKAAIPGLSQTLPKKYSGLGQEQLRDDDWISGIFNTMVNPGDADRIKTTEVTEFLDELYDLTGDLGIYPDAAAPKSFTQEKKTYTISTKEETETYQKTYGSEVNKLYSELIKFADFQNLDGADQAAVLEKAKEAARALAKSKISKKYTPPSSIKNKPIYKSDAQAILDAYIEAKRKAEKEAQKEAFRESYWANKNGQ